MENRMDRMTMREAALRSSRSITTLRRYIRSGRLRAEKRDGRFGPEYFVSDRDLTAAGLEPRSDGASLPARVDRRTSVSTQRVDQEVVTVSLYQELQMKHEQLLVQYGMMRAAGLRSMEMQDELRTQEARVRDQDVEMARQRKELEESSLQLQRKLRAAHLELEGRALEISALREKVKGLEMLTRNAVTNETIDRQFDAITSQRRRIDALRRRTDGPPPAIHGPETPDH
jgi:hypothetical protein